MNVSVAIKRNWIHNRTGREDSINLEGNYVIGCSLQNNKSLRKLEVLVNGDVVLCCDESMGRKVFGNVFQESIETIWNGPLHEYHKLIFARQYSSEKNSLICNNCTRAEYGKHRFTIKDTLKDIGYRESMKQLAKMNFVSV